MSIQRSQRGLEQIDSDAEFVLFSEEHGLISEHCTVAEARMAYFKQAAQFSLGERLPRIYQRDEPDWVPLS
jgi:hypothetical protein